MKDIVVFQTNASEEGIMGKEEEDDLARLEVLVSIVSDSSDSEDTSWSWTTAAWLGLRPLYQTY